MNTITIDDGSVELTCKNGKVVLPLGDQRFAPRYFEMTERIKKKTEEFADKMKGVSDIDTLQLFAINTEIHEYYKNEIDTLLGPETCYKVFGDIIPGTELYMQFFDQLEPHFKRYTQNREKLISKYSAERRGDA